MQQTQVWSLGWEDPLEEEMATHSSILAWEIPWTEETGGLQSMGSHSQTWLSNNHLRLQGEGRAELEKRKGRNKSLRQFSSHKFIIIKMSCSVHVIFTYEDNPTRCIFFLFLSLFWLAVSGLSFSTQDLSGSNRLLSGCARTLQSRSFGVCSSGVCSSQGLQWVCSSQGLEFAALKVSSEAPGL